MAGPSGSTAIQHLPFPTTDDTVDVPRDVGALATALDPLGYAPVGAIMMWATTAAPGGWLFCIGKQNGIDVATYPKLDQLFGHDAGNLINLPDLRDSFPVGAGPTMAFGSTGGASSVTLSAAQSGMPNHDHGGKTGIRDRSESHAHGGPWRGAPPAPVEAYVTFTAGGAGLAANSPTDDADTPDHLHYINAQTANASAGHENRPPFKALNFIIRAG